jgi:hypothetical protein
MSGYNKSPLRREWCSLAKLRACNCSLWQMLPLRPL